jgi:hypothetical protein
MDISAEFAGRSYVRALQKYTVTVLCMSLQPDRLLRRAGSIPGRREILHLPLDAASMSLIFRRFRFGAFLAAVNIRIQLYAELGVFKLQMKRELSELRTLVQALADLIAKRDECADASDERAQLERMIRDLQAEIAIREGGRR